MIYALVPLSLEESALVLKERIVPSRKVLVEKCDDDGNRFVKARLTARGDQDPELLSLVRNQQTNAQTVSTNGKVVTLQVIASLGADVELGDVTGAFLESAELNRQGGKLFLRQPSSGLPGLQHQQLLETRLTLYGLNDSPKRWFLEVSNFLRNIGWKSSALDECVFVFFDPESKVLTGILCLHVDDLYLGGCGTACRRTINALRSRFPFRKWKRNQGEFCGSRISQDVLTKEITVSQSSYALKINKVTAQPEDKATTAEIRSLRECNGAVQWLAMESGPDLAVQVSLSQQALSDPRVRHCRQANAMVRRAKQHHELTWRFLPIPLENLRLVMLSDAAFQNAQEGASQAGYIISVTDDRLAKGELAPWSPLIWRSHKMRRDVGSTLAAETQSLLNGLNGLLHILLKHVFQILMWLNSQFSCVIFRSNVLWMPNRCMIT